MKSNLYLFQVLMFCAMALGVGSSFSPAEAAEDSAATAPAKTSISWSRLGAKAGADYKGDGLAVIPTAEGALLRCVFQQLEGETTREGCWLTSTATAAVNDRFRIVAVALGREPNVARPSRLRVNGASSHRSASDNETEPELPGKDACAAAQVALSRTGTVEVAENLARFIRPGLTEEYSVSMDGVRQDFIIEQRPVGAGPLRVELVVAGAKVEPLADGAQLVLENSGRKIAYSRLRVTDATGKELTARIEVASGILPDVEGAHPADRNWAVDFSRTSLQERTKSGGLEALALRQAGMPAATVLAVLVNDSDAVYPVRIDPTFSDANWISMGGIPGADNYVYAAVVDGSGNLYIGGGFTVVGDVTANCIAKWNGSSWTALGSGMGGSGFFGPYVSALAVSGSDLYAGGEFTTAGGSPANYIAKWNGSSWSALGSGMNSNVYALVVSGSDVYAAGVFTTAGGKAANYIAKWNGGSWTALSSGMNDFVYALAVSGSDVYAGGKFSTAGGSSANYIAQWNGNRWSALGSGMDFYVSALAVSGSAMYAGGSFQSAGGNPANYIAKWNGSSWTALGSGMDGSVVALAVSGSDLYAGGRFFTAGGNAVNRIAKWNGSSWTALRSALGSGMNDVVSALAVSGSDVYAGGQFRTAGGSGANYIVKWNGSSWTALGSGMSGGPPDLTPYVSELALLGSDLYAGGDFTTAGGSAAANNIAKWNGSSWTALGSGIAAGPPDLTPYVRALAVSSSGLYAGGYFFAAGGSAANSIAKWDGNNWTALGSGMNGSVEALAVSGSNLYAGGAFTTAGGSAATNVAEWNGSSWTALGSGMSNTVSALAVSGSDVYAAGNFATVRGSAATIAKWDGNSWTTLGSGMDGYVYALAGSGSDLYAGGSFTTADGSAAANIAEWDGNSWTALGSGMNYDVRALAVSDSDLYAGGYFTTAGSSAANFVAKWNGSSWSTLGSGMGSLSGVSSYVSALAVSGNNLYAGGRFTTAGGKVSAYIARAYLLTIPTLSVRRSGIDIMLSWPSADTADFALEQAGMLPPPAGWVANTSSVSEEGTNNSVTIPATNSLQFFRLRRP